MGANQLQAVAALKVENKAPKKMVEEEKSG